MFLALLSLLIPAFSLLHRPSLLTVRLQPMHYAPLPRVFLNTAIWCFSPWNNIWRIALINRKRLRFAGCNSPLLFHLMKVFKNTHPKLRWCVLAPLHLRRTITRPVSYYALFECVAASEPTSWLSVQLHILSHLTHTSGP